MVGSSVLLLVVIGGPTVFANVGLSHFWARVVAYVWTGVLAGFTLLLGLSVLGVLAIASLTNTSGTGPGELKVVGPVALFAIAAGALMLLLPCLLLPLFSGQVRRRLARRLPVEADNPVHIVAIALLVISLVCALLQQVLLTAIPAIANQVFGSVSYTSLDIVSGELPFVVLGFLGVGVFMRRDLGQSLRRLGLVRPTLWQVALALAIAGALYLAADGLERLGGWLTPGLSQQLAQNNQSLFRQLANPVSAVIVGLAAGIGEEILFRGALQPRLGIISTALLFGVVHLNYGVSLSLLSVILVAVVLALLRRYTNTTTTIVTHATVDAIALGVSGWIAYPLTAAMAVVLGAVAVLNLLRGRRQTTGPLAPSAPAQAP
jgi:membrane protease YdiL (CAAX protease family)